MSTDDRQIPKVHRNNVWNKYIGESVAISQCYTGCGSEIKMFNFECGHIVAKTNGGKYDIDNLRPICGTCNKSMGTMHMKDFVILVGYDSKLLNEIMPVYTVPTDYADDEHNDCINKVTKVKPLYTCEKCNVTTNNKAHFNKHNETLRHKGNINLSCRYCGIA